MPVRIASLLARVLFGCLFVFNLWCDRLRAQAPDPGHELQLIESTEREEDPLGIDVSTGRELDLAAAALPKPKIAPPAPYRGAAISSIPGVREQRHQMELELARGLAFARVRMTFASVAKHAAEIAYRLPLPAGAVPTRLRVCRAAQCVDAAPEPASISRPGSEPGLALGARTIIDERGRALSLRVAPIAAGESLDVELEWVAEAPVRGGRARFLYEGRGYDPNLAPTELRVHGKQLSDVAPTAQTFDPWAPIEVVGRLRTREAEDVRTPCGAGSCTRHYEASPWLGAPARATTLFIDSSPSMEGPARSRLPPTLAALLSVLPEQSELRAYAFAAESEEIGRFRVGDAPLSTLSDASLRDLGAASKLSAIAQRASGSRVVVLSDGLFDASAEERKALFAMKQRGIETWLVVLGDAPPQFAELFSRVLDVSREAERALHGGELDALEDALRAVSAARTKELPSGEQRVIEKGPHGAFMPATGASWLAFWLTREPLAFVRRRAAEAIAATAYLDVPPPPPAEFTGMPRESVLSMLRTQLVPQARACLRSDRKGRADYAVELTFHAVFAQREIYEPRVTGNIPPALRGCLTALLPKLRVPAFSGRIRVRYPIFTEREAVPPAIELEPSVSQNLERAFAPARALP